MRVTQRITEVVDAVREHGINYVIQKYNLSSETIHRYERFMKTDEKKKAKILLFDIENTPIEAYVWSRNVWNTSVQSSHVIKEWNMLSWSAKWLYDNEVMGDVLTPKEAKKGNDKRIVASLWELLDEADIVIGHNAEKFDVGMANTRFIKHGLGRPSPYRIIDTLRIARREFNFTHNGLDALGEFLGIGAKIKTDFQLWKDCMAGDAEALELMSRYNDQDVILLEDLYLILRGWMKSHPNIALYEGIEHGCGVCGSEDITEKGSYVTNVNVYTTYVCPHCGGFTRDRKANKTKISTTSVAK